MRDIPYAVIFFPLYATLKEKAADSNGKNSMTSILAAGAAAGATAAAFCTPG
jgi:hydroxyethylthiazole kinase-like sugar kinase family protein